MTIFRPSDAVVCDEDAGHAAAAELALDVVGLGEDVLKLLFEFGHCGKAG